MNFPRLAGMWFYVMPDAALIQFGNAHEIIREPKGFGSQCLQQSNPSTSSSWGNHRRVSRLLSYARNSNPQNISI
jgi:hypothetical protein